MRDVQKILAALTSPVRREILTLIWARALPAGEIAAAFNLTPPTISQHLAVLRDAGLVSMTVDGNFRRYRARRDVLRGLHGALGRSVKWTVADDLPEQSLATARTERVVVVWADVDTDQATTFAAFTDPAVYSRWLGVPVTIDDGHFACTMERGTHVRGEYEVVHAPELIAMRWDFDDDNVPIPGGEMTGYLRVSARDAGAHVEVHQLVSDDDQAAFMEVAWKVTLGRLKAGVVDASNPTAAVARRARRPKRRASA